MENDSYIIIKRSEAVKAARVLAWLAPMLAAAGPSWHRHANDMRIVRAHLEDAIDMSKRASERARSVA